MRGKKMKKIIKKQKQAKKTNRELILKGFFITSLVFYIFQSVFCFAGEGAGTTAFNFLKIGAGARPVGMGEAYSALANDINAIYWNPAGLGEITEREITASYLSHIAGINSGYFGYALPLARGGLGVGVVYLDYGQIQETTLDDPDGVNLGCYRPYDLAVIAAYGCKVAGGLNVGINMKGVHEDIQGYTANAIAFDIGTLYDLPANDLTLSCSVKNLGLQTKAFIKEKHDLPLMFDFGLGYSLLADALKIGLNLYQPQGGNFNFNIGGEYCWKKLVSFRMGYKSIGKDLKTGSDKDNLTGLTVGLGVNMKVYQLDYAFVPFNELGNTHRLSFGLKFGKNNVAFGKEKRKVKKQKINKKKKVVKEQKISKKKKVVKKQKISKKKKVVKEQKINKKKKTVKEEKVSKKKKVVKKQKIKNKKVSKKNKNKKEIGVEFYQNGKKYAKQKKYQTAIKEYRGALKRGHKTAELYAGMGYCYYKLGNKKAAKSLYKRALALDPDNKRIKKNLKKISKKGKIKNDKKVVDKWRNL